ncbi:MAG: hypothetical protein ABW321_20155, partial [Polyangiales bacterium]
QIERAAAYRLRAQVVGSRLRISSRHEGNAARLELRAARAGRDALTVLTGAPAGSLPLRAEGTGLAADLAHVSATEYAAVISDGYFGRELHQTRVTTSRSTDCYRAGATAETRLVLESDRLGCSSCVTPLRASTRLTFDRSRERGPAVHASVLIQPASDPVVLSGALPIKLARPPENGAGDTTLTVELPNGSYTPVDIAARIDRVLQDAGLGRAAAYPDGSVVVESAIAGLGGFIELPASGSTLTTSVQDGLQLTAARSARGWPGAGLAETAGYRGRVDFAARALGVEWKLSSEERGVIFNAPAFTLAATHTSVEDVASALDALLAQATDGTSTRRIGIARVGTDGALYLEALAGRGLELEARDARGTLSQPQQPHFGGFAVEPALDPGLDLRRTDRLRTYRSAYDPRGLDRASELRDLGWVRIPTDADGLPAAVQNWLDGRHWIGARAEAGRAGSDAFAAEHADMVIAGGTADVAGELVSFIKQLRYFVSGDATRVHPLGIVCLGDTYLLSINVG